MIVKIFENENFVVCNKPSGVLSTPSRFEAQDERVCLGIELQKALGQQIYPVHRLDFEVSGLVMYALNEDAHRKANGWFENRQVDKTYRALTQHQNFEHWPKEIENPCWPINLEEKSHFEWKGRVLKGKRRAYSSPHGKATLTVADYQGLDSSGNLQWDLHPVTGRSHQLRFDLSRHGFPILGDRLYGSKVDLKDQKIALCSYRVNFAHAPSAEKLGLPSVIEIEPLFE